MGTASTMNTLAEALGLSLPGSSSIPAPMAERAHYSYRTGETIIDMVLNERAPRSFVTRQSFINAIVVNSAIGGSTNAVVHLLAAAKMCGIDFSLEDWDQYGQSVPLLVNVKPSGEYLMEEYYRAGGLPAVQRELIKAGLIDSSLHVCTGQTLAESIAEDDPYVDDRVIRPVDNPLQQAAGIVVLKGNLAPVGAILKVSAVENSALLQHTGRAVVFDSIEDYHRRIDES
jgi:dihydroxyacid dehydratase/phosphogluconate dehydratase